MQHQQASHCIELNRLASNSYNSGMASVRVCVHARMCACVRACVRTDGGVGLGWRSPHVTQYSVRLLLLVGPVVASLEPLLRRRQEGEGRRDAPDRPKFTRAKVLLQSLGAVRVVPHSPATVLINGSRRRNARRSGRVLREAVAHPSIHCSPALSQEPIRLLSSSTLPPSGFSL